MPGRSVEYVFALDRPMDMIPPIWLCALRCIQTKIPMMKRMGRRMGSSEVSQLACGVLYLTSTFLSLRTLRSVSGRPPASGPVEWNEAPLRSLPSMAPLVLSTSIWVTLPACTSVMKVE